MRDKCFRQVLSAFLLDVSGFTCLSCPNKNQFLFSTLSGLLFLLCHRFRMLLTRSRIIRPPHQCYRTDHVTSRRGFSYLRCGVPHVQVTCVWPTVHYSNNRHYTTDIISWPKRDEGKDRRACWALLSGREWGEREGGNYSLLIFKGENFKKQ